jgi:hypothetical protein
MFNYLKLTIYLRYAGSVDLWERTGLTSDKQAITYQDFLTIDKYSEQLRLATIQAISAEELAIQESAIQNVCESSGVFLRLKKIAEKKGGYKPAKTLLDRVLSWFLGA